MTQVDSAWGAGDDSREKWDKVKLTDEQRWNLTVRDSEVNDAPEK